MSNDTSMLAMRFARGAATSCDVSSRTIRTSEAENTFTSCLPAARSRSPQQQAEHVHLLVATRLVAEQFEQQRQLKPVMPSSRGRRRAVRTRHQRVCDIHATFHTRGRRRRTNDIANAPFWRYLSLRKKCIEKSTIAPSSDLFVRSSDEVIKYEASFRESKS